MRPKLTPIVDRLPPVFPFVGPETAERQSGSRFKARLGANESGFGPAPNVIAAIQAEASQVWKYCDPTSHDLKVAIAGHLGVHPDNIAIGEGIDGLQHLVCRLFLKPGDKALNSLGGYPAFNYHVDGCGAELVTVPYAGVREDLAGLLDCIRREQPRLVYLCNPDNPMGTWWPAEDIVRFIEAVPSDVMVVLDEAYGETAAPGTLPPIDIIRPNLFRTRTFSKAYGLAGIRCGYAVADAETVGYLDRIRNHYGVNRLAQVAGVAAIADQDWLNKVVAWNAAARERLHAIARDNGLASIPSGANFVTIDTGRDGPFAQRVLRSLFERGVFIRKPGTPGLDHHIRVSTGPDAELDVFAEALPLALKDAAA
jgi:histidinol-phosphate aminotransferase